MGDTPNALIKSKHLRRKASVRSGGRKLCDTILLDGEDETIIVGQEEEAKGQVAKESNCLNCGQKVEANYECVCMDNMPDEHETSFLASEADPSSLEEWSTISWKLPSFVGRFKSYLDNEGKEINEVVPVRVSLLNTGTTISIYSTFIVSLYLSHLEDKDLNANSNSQVNLHLQQNGVGATYVAKPVESDVVLMSVTLKLVEHSQEQPVHLHYKVTVEAPDIGYQRSLVHLFTGISNGGLSSVAEPIDLQTLMKMSASDDLHVTVAVCVYEPPIKWPLNKTEIKKLIIFMSKANIEMNQMNDTDRQFVKDLMEKCGQQLSGIRECLNAVISFQNLKTS